MEHQLSLSFFFFFNDPPTTEIYTLPLHAALPIPSNGSAANSSATPADATYAARRPPDCRRPLRSRDSFRRTTTGVIEAVAVLSLIGCRRPAKIGRAHV